MTKKEKFIIKMLFQKMGLSSIEAEELINKLKENGFKYERIIKKKMHIYSLIEYCRMNKYSNNYMNEVINAAVKRHSSKKIIIIDEVLKMNNYRKKEREYIETRGKEIFQSNKETLNNRIMYFDDNKLRNLTIINPRGLTIGIELCHARIELFKRKNLSLEKNTTKLFEDNIKFKYDFNVTSDDLRRMYPLPEKYLIKK